MPMINGLNSMTQHILMTVNEKTMFFLCFIAKNLFAGIRFSWVIMYFSQGVLNDAETLQCNGFHPIYGDVVLS